MKYLRNISPFKAHSLTEMIKHSENGIASRAFIDDEHSELRLFSFAAGESIDKEYYEMDTLLLVIDGRAKIIYGADGELTAGAGEIVALESGTDYGIEAVTDLKLFSIMVKK